MDATRFDALTRSLTDARSRRGALATLLGGPLGVLGFIATAAKKTGKHAHGEGKRKKGKGKKGRGKKKGRGTISPTPDASPPPGDPAPPPADPCPGQPDDTICFGSGKCFQGSCIPRPTCAEKGSACFGSNAPNASCCGGYCLGTGAPEGICAQSEAGAACYTTSHCGSGLSCVAYRCRYHLCQAGADSCIDDTTTCNGDGGCFQPIGGGPTRCGKPTLGASCGCASDEPCTAHGLSAFCVTFTEGGDCFCSPGVTTFCATPH